MTAPPRDGSRDRRIEDPSNLYLIHPAAHAILPVALANGVSANAVSMLGLCFGAGAAAAYAQWQNPWMALVGLACSAAWLIADGLDGMIARATGTASAIGRALDGLCDHGVFALLYMSLAWSIGTPGAWALAILAAVAHAVQSSLYEGERARFHRRVRGEAMLAVPAPTGMFLVRLYDSVAFALDRSALPFERRLAADPVAFGEAYGNAAAPVMKFQSLLTANVRVGAIFVACLLASPSLFWWFEIVPLTVITVIGLLRHRAVERRLLGVDLPRPIILSSKQGHP